PRRAVPPHQWEDRAGGRCQSPTPRLLYRREASAEVLQSGTRLFELECLRRQLSLAGRDLRASGGEGVRTTDDILVSAAQLLASAREIRVNTPQLRVNLPQLDV